MGCASSSTTVVQTFTPDEVNGDEDDTRNKLGGCGGSAVSKGTADSGVVMESKEVPLLPGIVPRKLPPLTSASVLKTSSGLLQQERAAQERQKSSDILEELLNQGIIPEGQTIERSSRAWEAYSLMLNDMEVVRQRPARLESLKAKQAQALPSIEDIEEKMKLAEERRKLKENELKARLRTKSARVRVRAPISRTDNDENSPISPVGPLQSSVSLDILHPPLHSQTACKEAEGGECVKEARGDQKESRKEMGSAEKTEGREKVGASGATRGEGAKRVCEKGDEEEEELNQLEELQSSQLLKALWELESDSTFQHAEDKEEKF
uniref:uncharacterized protein stmnd1 n=1 Tax=Monopterus albus TaxID=43700 RepID=UPI0009B327B1|nr:stathmin domain-containing protein 1 [Monopterus albus]